MKKLLVIATILLSSLVASAQNQYYVAPSPAGSDSNNGSQASPWLTIAHADAALTVGSSGAVVHVAPGSYSTGGFSTNKSGTGVSVTVRFQCDTPLTCKVNWTGGGHWQTNGSWEQVVGFEMAGNGLGSTAIDILGNHDDALGNYIHDFTGGGCQFTGAINEVGNNGATQGGVISGNKIINVGPTSGCNVQHGIYTILIGTRITNNVIGRISAYGIHSHGFGCQSVISNNTVFNAGKGGIIVSLGTGAGGCNVVDFVTLTNNIAIHSGNGNPGGAGGISFGGNLSGSTCANSGVGTHILLQNNLTYGNGGGDYNLCTGAGYNPTIRSGTDATVLVNYQANGLGDYHLKSGSPAVGAGITSCATGTSNCVPSLDFDKLVRPNPPSIGAYELTSSGGTPASSISPTSWDFGNVTISTPSTTKLFTYTSTGTASVTISNEAISGPNAADFAFAGVGSCTANTTSYAPGANCTISAKCTPSTIATETATLTVTDNGSTSPLVVPLSCTGRPGSGGGGTASLSLSQSSVVFTYISVNTDAAGPVITASNVGTASMLISNITFADSTNWHATSTCIGVPVAPGGNCKITPFLKPLSAGAKATTMTILSNATESPTTVSLSGTAVQSNVGASPSSLTFSDTPIGSTTPSQNVTVSNTAANAQARLTINLTGPYSQTNTCSAGFSDTFSSGSLNPALWVIDGGGAPGTIAGVNTGTFSASNVDMSQGALALKVTQSGSAPVTSIGAEVRSVATYGFGTYDWLMRSSSTATSPDGAGSVTSGQISSAFSFINGSETEIDVPEIEGQSPNTLEFTSWSWLTSKQFFSSTLANPEAAYHHYTMVWLPSSITFSVDGVVVGTNTTVVPQIPAYILMNHWGTNSSSFGGLATTGVTRWQYFKGFTFTPSSASIPAGGSCTISVAFQPTSNGAAPGSLQMTVPDGGPQPTIPLGGNGVIPTNGVLVIGGVKFQIGIQILK